jgi:hypothetical protein
MLPENEILSDLGRRRREEILRLAMRQTRRRRRNRRLREAGMILVCVAILATRQESQQRPAESPKTHTPPMVMVPASTVIIERIGTDSQITAKLSTGNAPPRWSFIDDDAFLQSMADAGRPSGLIMLNGRLLLLPR